MRTVATIVLLVSVAASTQAADESLRCGNRLVRAGMTMNEVEKACGKPTSSSVEEVDVRAGPRVVGKTKIHTWRYDRGTTQKTAVLEFDQDNLRSIRYE